jgi:hypothetical protein
MDKAAITERLRRASALSDLTPERRLDGKIDMSKSAVTARLRECADLLELCRRLADSRSLSRSPRPRNNRRR